MIVGAAVCPGAPFLMDGTAPWIAARMKPVVRACAAAVARLPQADALLLVSAGAPPQAGIGHHAHPPSWRLLEPGTPVAVTGVRRSDLRESRPVRLSAADQAAPPARSAPETVPAVGTMVGACLLAARGPSSIPTTAIEVGDDPDGVAAMLAGRVNTSERLTVLVIADGSACHGDDAPGRRDDRAEPFDAALAAALAAGDPAALGAVVGRRALARALLATVDPLAVLAQLSAPNPPTSAELLYSAAPLGVGYLVALWRWSNP